MGIKILQANLNNCWRAHDLLAQQVLELKVGVCILTEPRKIPKSPYWFGSENGRAAIKWIPERTGGGGCIAKRKGRDYVLVSCGGVSIISCYISPNAKRERYLEFLDELEEVVREEGQGLIIGGDFNARSLQWDRKANWRGDLVEEWAAGCDLRLENIGEIPTCIRPQGMSVVDLTWSSPGVVRVEGWCVEGDMETASDHAYITFSVETGPWSGIPATKRRKDIRWDFKKMDRDMLNLSLLWSCWVGPGEEDRSRGDKVAEWVERTMTEACEASTPRVRKPGPRNKVHWWNEELSELRRICIRKRREWTRSKGKGRNAMRGTKEEEEYRKAKRKLKNGIYIAKGEAWMDLIATVEEDPWGRPYRMVMSNLRKVGRGLTEQMEEEQVEDLLNGLFPRGMGIEGDEWMEEVEWDEGWNVGMEEVKEAIQRKKKGDKAPGLDGIKASVWEKVPEEMMEVLKEGFTVCMKEGTFPEKWKEARLVLIPKGGSDDEGRPKVRPICLIREIGKIFERILANRLNNWMEEHPEAGLANNQHGFRKGRSTIDALMRVKNAVRETREEGGVVVAVSLDVTNAFNAVPWKGIMRALERKGFPSYLRRILCGYLSRRRIRYPLGGDKEGIRYMEAGVPQGSVLGPILWNIAYDEVLRTEVEEGCEMVGYADDTLVLATAEDTMNAAIRASVQVGRVVRRIRGIGLEVAAGKTEAMVFGNKRRGRGRIEERPDVEVGGMIVELRDRIKYLGVIWDEDVTFKPHFEYAEGKGMKVVKALGRLMPNLRGPGEHKRRLYASVVMSVLLYAAPVWSDAFGASETIQAPIRRVQRAVSLRVIAAYRTVSYVAATLLARSPPAFLLAANRKRMYDRTQDLRRLGVWTKEGERMIRREEDLLLRRQWALYLQNPRLRGRKTTEVILPVYQEWMDCGHRETSFRLTQVLTGHGCLNTYLKVIGKVESALCPECKEEDDTVQHMIGRCKVWEREREVLREDLGGDLDLGLESLLRKMLRSKEVWKRVVKFINEVVGEKERREKERQAGRGRSITTPSLDRDAGPHA